MSIEWPMAGSFKNKRRSIAVALLVSACVTLAASGCSLLPQEEEPEKLPEIRAPKIAQKPEYPVKKGTLNAIIKGSGKLMSVKEENVMFTEDNRRVTEVYVKPGDKVKKGQLLAELESGDTANLIARKEVELEKAELDLKGAMRNDAQENEIALRKTQLDFRLLGQELAELRKKLESSQLRAPYDGTLVSFKAEKGDMSRAYEKVGRIADLNTLVIAAKFDSGDLSAIAPGMETTVSINAFGDITGKIGRMPLDTEEADSDADTTDGYVLIDVEKLPEGVQFGTPLSAAVVAQRREGVLYVPISAIRKQNDRSYVLVSYPDGSKGEMDVELGLQTLTDAEIISGLEEGQKVVGK